MEKAVTMVDTIKGSPSPGNTVEHSSNHSRQSKRKQEIHLNKPKLNRQEENSLDRWNAQIHNMSLDNFDRIKPSTHSGSLSDTASRNAQSPLLRPVMMIKSGDETITPIDEVP